jgi:hypothetical protein
VCATYPKRTAETGGCPKSQARFAKPLNLQETARPAAQRVVWVGTNLARGRFSPALLRHAHGIGALVACLIATNILFVALAGYCFLLVVPLP